MTTRQRISVGSDCVQSIKLVMRYYSVRCLFIVELLTILAVSYALSCPLPPPLSSDPVHVTGLNNSLFS